MVFRAVFIKFVKKRNVANEIAALYDVAVDECD
jgi:hypothetical protein